MQKESVYRYFSGKLFSHYRETDQKVPKHVFLSSNPESRVCRTPQMFILSCDI